MMFTGLAELGCVHYQWHFSNPSRSAHALPLRDEIADDSKPDVALPVGRGAYVAARDK